MNTNGINETNSIEPTTHKSFSIGPSLLTRKMFHHLDLTSLFSPLKKRGTKPEFLTEALISYKLTENFSIKHFHSWIMQPEMRDYYSLDAFNERTTYRLLETLGENFDYLISGIQDRLFSRYTFHTTDVNMDWTSIVLHGFSSPLGKYGYSRDHRPDKHQITLGITELAQPNNIPIGVTVRAGNINDTTHFKPTFFQSQKRLKQSSLIIFDKGAESKQNIELVRRCGHDYLTAKKLNKSDDKLIDTFWARNPHCLNPDEKQLNKKIYGLILPKKSSINYLYFSEPLAQRNLESLSRKVYQKFQEAEVIQDCLDKGKPLPKVYRPTNPFFKISYSVQTKLIRISEGEAIEFLKKKLQTGREGFFALTSSRNLTAEEALQRYREKDSIEKIFHSLKNEIEIKPLRVWTENSIRGAILIGFLAQLFVSLVRFEVPEAKHTATKFILLSLKNLTLTVMKLKNGVSRCVYSNFEPLNQAVLRIKGG